MGDSSARPCDSCEARRARWFCAADGAYLCHACDTSVHTANSVASRHDRVRLTRSAVPDGDLFPSWPRKRNRSQRRRDITTLPATTRPDLQQFLSSASDGDSFGFQVEDLNLPCFASPGSVHGGDDHSLNNDHPYLARTNLIEPEDSNGEQPFSWLFDRVKVEESDDGHGRFEAEAGPDGLFDLNIDFFHFTANTDDVKEENCYFNDEEKKICLTLNYEDVLSAWSDRGSPWADQNTQHDAIATERKTGIENVIVPELNLWRRSYGDQIEGVPVMAGNGVRNYKSCGGREARVKRYREKKRSRLFSKRIRYHVRKLNAEKRPRMKGRFVKTVGDVFSETKGVCLQVCSTEPST